MTISTDALFGRRWCVTLTSDVDTAVARYGNVDAAATPLRIVFDVTKNLLSSPNRGVIQITNMSSANRSKLRPGLNVALEVGYQGPLQLLFYGRLLTVKSERRISDVVTSLEIMDGDAAISTIPFDKPYPANSQTSQVINDIITLLAVPTAATPKGITSGPVSGLPSSNYSNGYTAHGSVRDTLNEICGTAGLEWSIQNNQMTIIPLNNHAGATGRLISKDTGMVGTPTFDGKLLTVSCLCDPLLVPGQTVMVIGQDGINGVFKIRGGKWQGDSSGDTWSVEIEATPLVSGGPVPLPNKAGTTLKSLATAAKQKV